MQNATALLLLLLHSAAGSLTTLKDDAQFEAEVVQDPVVWGVLFTSKTRDDDAKSKAMLQAAHGLAAGLGRAEGVTESIFILVQMGLARAPIFASQSHAKLVALHTLIVPSSLPEITLSPRKGTMANTILSCPSSVRSHAVGSASSAPCDDTYHRRRDGAAPCPARRRDSSPTLPLTSAS